MGVLHWVALGSVIAALGGNAGAQPPYSLSQQPAFAVSSYYHGRHFRDVTLSAFGPATVYSAGDSTSSPSLRTIEYSAGDILNNGADDTKFIAPVRGKTPPLGLKVSIQWTPRGSDCFRVTVYVATLQGFKDPSHLAYGEDSAIIDKASFDDTVIMPLGDRQKVISDRANFSVEVARLEGSRSSLTSEEIQAGNLRCQMAKRHAT